MVKVGDMVKSDYGFAGIVQTEFKNWDDLKSKNDYDIDTWYQVIGFFSLMVYLLLSLRYYLNYRAFIVQELSYADNLQFTWV